MGIEFEISLDKSNLVSFLFAETPSRYIVEIRSSNLNETINLLKEKVPFEIIGKTSSQPEIKFDSYFSLSLTEIKDKWERAIPRFMED